MKNLDELREEITAIDEQLVQLFAMRFAIVQEVGEYKKTHNLPIRDEKRENELMQRLSEKAQELHLSPSFIHAVWQAIFQEAYRKEETA
jgi:chorismate mutase-like protein